jgi:hypothetical protein
MLLFFALSTTLVAAQTNDKFTYDKGKLIFLDSLTNLPKDTLTVPQFMEIQKTLSIQQQVELNKKLFDAMRKEDQ